MAPRRSTAPSLLLLWGLLAALLAGRPSGLASARVVVPHKEGWCRGRRLLYYEFEGSEEVLPGDAPARMYTVVTANEAGGYTPVPHNVDVVDTIPLASAPGGARQVPAGAADIKYTGLWAATNVVIPAADVNLAASLKLGDHAALLKAAADNRWAVRPTGAFLHCPVVAADTTLQRHPSTLRALRYAGASHSCMQLRGDVRHYPAQVPLGVRGTNGEAEGVAATLPVWELRRLPTLQHVAGNTLIDVSPDEHGFVPFFKRRYVNVGAAYVANSVQAVDGLRNVPHDVAGGQQDSVVSWHLYQIAAPAWDGLAFQHQRSLAPLAPTDAPAPFAANATGARRVRTDGGTVSIRWSVDAAGDSMHVLLKATAGVGWVGLGFSTGATEAEARRLGTETVLFYRDEEKRGACVRFGYVPAVSTQYTPGPDGTIVFPAQPDPLLSPDNLLGVTEAAMEVHHSGETSVFFKRKLAASTFDSQGFTQPDGTVVANALAMMTFSVQSGPAVPSCAAPPAGVFNALYRAPWQFVPMVWGDANMPAPTPPAPVVLPPQTPSPVLTAVTPAPPTVPHKQVRGLRAFNTRLSLAWEMKNEKELHFSMQYKGNLSADKVWVGFGLGGEFRFADIITVWVDRGGTVWVEDRKSIGHVRPPLDGQQDVTLVAHTIEAGLTVVNFTRPLVARGKETSVRVPTHVQLTRQVFVRRLTGFHDGASFSYLDIETPGGGPFGASGTPKTTPLLLLLSHADALLINEKTLSSFLHTNLRTSQYTAIPGQYPLLTTLPGSELYSDIKEVVVVVVPPEYTGAVITWAHAVPAAWEVRRTGIFINCPAIDPTSDLDDVEDRARFPKLVNWYSEKRAYCLDLGVRVRNFPVAPLTPAEAAAALQQPAPANPAMLLWEQLDPATHASVGAVVNQTVSPLPHAATDAQPAPAYYSGLFLAQKWNGTVLRRHLELPEFDALPVVNRSADLPPALATDAAWRIDNERVLYVNRPVVDVPTAGIGETPAPGAGQSGYDKEMQVYPPAGWQASNPTKTPVATIFLRWTVNGPVGTVDVQIEARFPESKPNAYVAVGFSNASYVKMNEADIVLGMRDVNQNVCLKSLHSVSEFGVPRGTATMRLANEKLEISGASYTLSFTRGVDGGAHGPGRIPADPFTPSRVLYAVHPAINGFCASQSVDFLRHGANPHGSATVYWHLTNGNIETSPPTSGLPRPLDGVVQYREELSYFLNSRVRHYTVNNGVSGAGGLKVQTMYVYEIWRPRGMNAIVDSVPGLSDYSDLMKVRRVRLPDQTADDITSLDALRKVDAFIEETDQYWDCPVVSSKSVFLRKMTHANGTEGEEVDPTITYRDLWYQSQPVRCAYFSTTTTDAVDRTYAVYEEGEDTSQAPSKRIVTNIPSSVHYTPFKYVYNAVVKVGQRSRVNSATDLLATAVSITKADPPVIVNVKVIAVDPGTPMVLPQLTIALKPAWLDSALAEYVDFSDVAHYEDGTSQAQQSNGVVGRIPILEEANIVTSEVFVLRQPRTKTAPGGGERSYVDYYDAEPAGQLPIASVVPGQTGYSHIWKVTLVTIPDSFIGTLPIKAAGDLPAEWVRTNTDIILSCPVVNAATTLAAFADGSAVASVPKRRWYWNGAEVSCFLLRESRVPPGNSTNPYGAVAAADSAAEPYLNDLIPGKAYVLAGTPAKNSPILDTHPAWSITGLVRPREYTPTSPSTATQLYRREDDVRTFQQTTQPWALNWPVLSVARRTFPNTDLLDRTGRLPLYNLSRPKVGLYRGKLLSFWPVHNETARLPSSLRLTQAHRTGAAVEEAPAHDAETSAAYVFYHKGRLVTSLKPVFDSVPESEWHHDGRVVGHSDLKILHKVSIPDAVDPVQVTSVRDIALKQWPVLAEPGVYYYWPLCRAGTTVPTGVEVQEGFAEGSPVSFIRLSQQRTRRILRAYRVASGKIVLPRLPEDAGYSVFHTLWEAPNAPDSFDPASATEMARQIVFPVYPSLVYTYPILSAPSASSLSNEVDEVKLYAKEQAWLAAGSGGSSSTPRRVFFYRFVNTPAPFDAAVVRGGGPAAEAAAVRTMPVYALRYNSTALEAEEAQSHDVSTRSAGQDGYSDLHHIHVTEVPRSGARAAAALPLRSHTALEAEAYAHAWSTVPTPYVRVAPAVHAGSRLAERAHRYRYAKTRVFHESREVTYINFGLYSTPGLAAQAAAPSRQAAVAQAAYDNLLKLTTVYKAVNSRGLVSYIMSSGGAAGAGGSCREIVKLADTTAQHPLTTLEAGWEECGHRLSEVTCPRQHCVWNGTCAQPLVYYTCPVVADTARRAPLVSLTRSAGYLEGRRLTYYNSPNPVPGNRATAFTDVVYVFRHPPAPKAGETTITGAYLLSKGTPVEGLPPVFENLPGSGGTYSDLHRIFAVGIPEGWLDVLAQQEGTTVSDTPMDVLFGKMTTTADVRFIAEKEGWSVMDSGLVGNYWVVDEASEVEPRDRTLVPKVTGYAEGVSVAYFDFGWLSASALNHAEKYVLYRNTAGARVTDNDLYTQVQQVSQPGGSGITPLFWEVGVLVGTAYSTGNLTNAQELSGLTADGVTHRRIVNNPVVSLEAPVTPLAYDDLTIDPLSPAQPLLWASGPLEAVTQRLLKCADRGTSPVSLLERADNTGRTPIPFVSGGVVPTMQHCLPFTEGFTFCWVIDDAQLFGKFVMKNGRNGGIGISETQGLRNADIWRVIVDPNVIPSSENLLKDCWNGEETHSAAPPVDIAVGGTPDLGFVLHEVSEVRDQYNVTFRRALVTPDARADANLSRPDHFFYVSWATGDWNHATHQHTGILCVNFLNGRTTTDCLANPFENWWTDFTALYAVMVILAGVYTTRYSPKNWVHRVNVFFQVRKLASKRVFADTHTHTHRVIRTFTSTPLKRFSRCLI